MGFWHSGLHGVYDPATLVSPEFLQVSCLFSCDQCGRNFSALEDLRRHRFEHHPTRQPALLIRGRPVGNARLKVQSALMPTDVVIEDGTRCWVDDRSISAETLRLLLADATTDFYVIRLSNDHAQTCVELDFQVAEEDDLRGVERALFRLASSQNLTLETIGAFITEARGYRTGISYCDGIANYLFGVMAKERLPGTGLDREDYLTKYSQSVDQLTDIARPLARSVRSLILFHFNHFFDLESLAPNGRLKDASSAFAWLLDGTPWHFGEGFSAISPGAIEDLLTDQVTLEILHDASRGLSSLKWMKDSLLVTLEKLKPGFDRTKRLLLTIEALSHNDEREVREMAKKLFRQLAPRDFSPLWRNVVFDRINNI